MRRLLRHRDLYKSILAIALPVAAQSVVSTGVNLVDTIMLGKLSETALSASALANGFILLFTFLMMGISMGASVLASRYWGAGDLVSLRKAITITFRISIALSLVFTLVNVLFTRKIMALYIDNPDVIMAGAQYLIWSSASFLLIGLSISMSNFLRCISRGHVPLLASVAAFLVNIAANYAFIFGNLGMPAMGVAGAALGTLIARAVETAIIALFFFNINNPIRYRLAHLAHPCGDLLNGFLKISIPVVLSDGLLGMGDNVLSMIMGRIGTEFVSANAIANVLQRVSTIFVTGIAFSACFIIGRSLGEGSLKRAEDESHVFLGIGLFFGLLASVLVLAINKPFAAGYQLSGETHEILRQLVEAISLMIIFRSLSSVLTKGILRGGGDTRFLLIADLSTLWLVAIPLGAIAALVLRLPAFWVYICLHADQIIKTIWCIARLKSGKWIVDIKTAVPDGIMPEQPFQPTG